MKYLILLILTLTSLTSFAVIRTLDADQFKRVTSGTAVLTLPVVSGTLSTLAGTETLTNKTLTTPAIVSGTISTPTITGPNFVGNVGVGTATPTVKLDVVGAIKSSGTTSADNVQVGPGTSLIYLRNVGGINRIDSYNNPITATIPMSMNALSHDFKVADVTRMTLSASGNLGVGTTTPAANLAVTGSVRLTTGSPTTDAVLMSTNASGDVAWVTSATAATKLLGATSGSAVISTNSLERVERLTVNTICTASPCTITSQSGGFASVTRSGTGDYVGNFVAGKFQLGASCQVSGNNGANFIAFAVGVPTASSFTFASANSLTAALVDTRFTIICVGPR